MTKTFFTLLHLFFNSLLIFSLMALLTECFLGLFQIKSPRVRAFMRLIPLVKITLDICLYKTSFSFFFNLNPFGCKTILIRKFLKLFSLNDSLLQKISPFFVVGLLMVTLFLLGWQGYRFLSSFFSLRILLKGAKKSEKIIKNSHLQSELLRLKVKVVTSTMCPTPFATLSSYIVLPAVLVESLSQKEYEAVIAHELEHIRWKDPLVKIISHLLASLLWWIPIRAWLKKLEMDQEEACDRGIASYGIPTFSLATGIVKAINCAKHCFFPSHIVCQITKPKNIPLYRLERLLSPQEKTSPANKVQTLAATSLSLVPLFLFWCC